jgi:hypothetical protein
MRFQARIRMESIYKLRYESIITGPLGLHSILPSLRAAHCIWPARAFSAVTRANSRNSIADPRSLSRRLTRDHIPLGRQDSVIQCMFWCMLASDITAIYCDILQNLCGSHVFYYVCPMRISALTCSVLQSSRDWTQNPPPSLAYEFDSRSRHHYNQQFRTKIPKRRPVKRPNPPTLSSHGGSTPSGINIKHSSSIN